MRILLLLTVLLGLISQTVFADGWSLGVSACPAIAAPRVDVDLPSPRQHFAYSIGVVGVYDLSSGLFGKAVLQYSRKEVLIAKGIPDTRDAVDPSTGRIELSRIVYGDASETYDSFCIPLTINWRVAKGASIDMVVLGGIECGILYRRTSILEPTVTGTSEYAHSESGFVSSLMIGAGLSYSASDNVTVLMLPEYSYSLFPAMEFGSLSFHTIAVECAILYRL